MNNYFSTSLLASQDTSTISPLSSLSPVKLQYINENSNIDMPFQTLVFKDGFKAVYNKSQQKIKDSTFTRHTYFNLTDPIKWSDIFSNSKKELNRLEDFGFFYGFLQNRFDIENQASFIQINANNELAISQQNKALVKFTKLPSGKTEISFTKNQEKIILVVERDPIYNTFNLKGVSAKEYNENYIKEFNVSIIKDYVTISYEVPSYDKYSAGDFLIVKDQALSSRQSIERFIGIRNNKITSAGISFNFSTSFFNASKYNDDNNIFKTYLFKIVNEAYEPIVFGSGSTPENLWAAYYNNAFDKKNNKNVNINPDTSVFNSPVNYLLISNYKTDISSGEKTLKTNVIALKTMYTVEGQIAKTSNIYLNGEYLTNVAENLKPIQRSYTKIFASNNSLQEYDKVYLGFSAGTRSIELKPDYNTFFHYPVQANSISLNDAGLSFAGALPGPAPYLADKIFTKNTNYGRDTYWGHQTAPSECPDGTFLCTWLSGDIQDPLNSVWIDRWYEGASVVEASALFTSQTTLSSNNSPIKIYDLPSTVNLSPGGYYFYSHIGNNTIDQYIDSLNIQTTSLRLQTSTSFNTIIDTSQYSNSIKFYNDKDTSLFISEKNNEYVINLNNNFAKIQSDALDLTKEFTVSMWVNSDSWTNNPGYYILDNSFRSGWSLNVNNGFFNPVLCIGESNYGHLPILTTELLAFTDCITPVSIGEHLTPDSVLVTDDLYTFVFDKNNKSLLKYEYNGDLVDLISFKSYSQEITSSKIMLSDTNKLHLAFNDNFYITDTEFAASSSFNISFSNFTLDLSGNIIGGNFRDVAIDNYNTIWYISSCPIDFFTSNFFQDTSTNINYLTGSDSISFIFYRDPSTGVTSPINITDLNSNNITKPILYPNSIHPEDGSLGTLLSKPFEPRRLHIDSENNLYCVNDNNELLKLSINSHHEAGFLYKKTIGTKPTISGLNFNDIDEETIISFNQSIRTNKTSSLLNLKKTQTTWSNTLSTESFFTLMYEYNDSKEMYETYIYSIDNMSGVINKLDKEGNKILDAKLISTFDPFTAGGINKNLIKVNNITSSYDWHRKYVYLPQNKTPRIEFQINTVNNNQVTRYTLPIPSDLATPDEWLHLAATFSSSKQQINLFFNGNIVSTVSLPTNTETYYRYKNDIGVGTGILRTESLLEELKSTDYIYRGKINDIKIYDYSLNSIDLTYFILKQIKVPKIDWNIDAGTRGYVETIEKFYKNKIPGNKSNLFDINLLNTKNPSLKTKEKVEKLIKTTIKDVAPTHTKLNQVKWF